jgi:uncharacterized membrane protein
MYTIIGGDGKEYGPVSAEQVRGWIAGGRANLKTRVKALGSDEWKSVEDFPELTAAAATVSASSAPARNLDILSCYERSWTLLKANFWPLVGVNLLVVVMLLLIGATHFGAILMGSLLGGVIVAGQYYFFLLRVRGQPATLKDAFAGFTKAFVQLLVADILLSLFYTLGLICLVLPGIYLVVAYSFTYVLAADKGLGFWEAMETSRRVATGQWWRVFGLMLLGIPFALLGIAALGVGLLVTWPLITGAFVYAYEDLFNAKPAAPVTPSSP